MASETPWAKIISFIILAIVLVSLFIGIFPSIRSSASSLLSYLDELMGKSELNIKNESLILTTFYDNYKLCKLSPTDDCICYINLNIPEDYLIELRNSVDQTEFYLYHGSIKENTKLVGEDSISLTQEEKTPITGILDSKQTTYKPPTINDDNLYLANLFGLVGNIQYDFDKDIKYSKQKSSPIYLTNYENKDVAYFEGKKEKISSPYFIYKSNQDMIFFNSNNYELKNRQKCEISTKLTPPLLEFGNLINTIQNCFPKSQSLDSEEIRFMIPSFIESEELRFEIDSKGGLGIQCVLYSNGANEWKLVNYYKYEDVWGGKKIIQTNKELYPNILQELKTLSCQEGYNKLSKNKELQASETLPRLYVSTTNPAIGNIIIIEDSILNNKQLNRFILSEELRYSFKGDKQFGVQCKLYEDQTNEWLYINTYKTKKGKELQSEEIRYLIDQNIVVDSEEIRYKIDETKALGVQCSLNILGQSKWKLVNYYRPTLIFEEPSIFEEANSYYILETSNRPISEFNELNEKTCKEGYNLIKNYESFAEAEPKTKIIPSKFTPSITDIITIESNIKAGTIEEKNKAKADLFIYSSDSPWYDASEKKYVAGIQCILTEDGLNTWNIKQNQIYRGMTESELYLEKGDWSQDYIESILQGKSCQDGLNYFENNYLDLKYITEPIADFAAYPLIHISENSPSFSDTINIQTKIQNKQTLTQEESDYFGEEIISIEITTQDTEINKEFENVKKMKCEQGYNNLKKFGNPLSGSYNLPLKEGSSIDYLIKYQENRKDQYINDLKALFFSKDIFNEEKDEGIGINYNTIKGWQLLQTYAISITNNEITQVTVRDITNPVSLSSKSQEFVNTLLNLLNSMSFNDAITNLQKQIDEKKLIKLPDSPSKQTTNFPNRKVGTNYLFFNIIQEKTSNIKDIETPTYCGDYEPKRFPDFEIKYSNSQFTLYENNLPKKTSNLNLKFCELQTFDENNIYSSQTTDLQEFSVEKQAKIKFVAYPENRVCLYKLDSLEAKQLDLQKTKKLAEQTIAL